MEFKYEARAVKRAAIRLSFSGLFLFRVGESSGTFDLSSEQARHFWMTLALGELAALFEHLERARYVPPGEIDAGLAKDARVTLARGAGIHARTYDSTRCGRNARFDPRRRPAALPAVPRLSLFARGGAARALRRRTPRAARARAGRRMRCGGTDLCRAHQAARSGRDGNPTGARRDDHP